MLWGLIYSRSGTGNGALKLLSGAQLRQVETHLTCLLDRVLHADGLAPLNQVIRSYVLFGGKRIRPQLCAWAFTNLSDAAPPSRLAGNAAKSRSGDRSKRLPPSLLDLACAWELFHAFLLCHDDIIDGADQRRDRPSLHRQLQSLDHNCPKFGVNLGIVAGDLLFSSAMRLWHEIELPPKIYRDELRLFSRIACTTGFGQAIDICQSHAPLDDVHEEVLLRGYHWKTAAYTFEGPMLSGAILAGADAKTQSAISAFALALGQAYQLQNDLLDLSAPAHEGSDLMQGKRTVTLIRARQSMSASKRRTFDQSLRSISSANGQSLAVCDSLRAELRNSGAAEHTQELIEQFLKTAGQATHQRCIPAKLRSSMQKLLTSLQNHYFRTESRV
jgi:geranylgeranyl diphosphate synthase type I